MLTLKNRKEQIAVPLNTKKARRFYWGDVNGDGKQDITVLYTIEGFNCGIIIISTWQSF